MNCKKTSTTSYKLLRFDKFISNLSLPPHSTLSHNPQLIAHYSCACERVICIFVCIYKAHGSGGAYKAEEYRAGAQHRRGECSCGSKQMESVCLFFFPFFSSSCSPSLYLRLFISSRDFFCSRGSLEAIFIGFESSRNCLADCGGMGGWCAALAERKCKVSENGRRFKLFSSFYLNNWGLGNIWVLCICGNFSCIFFKYYSRKRLMKKAGEKKILKVTRFIFFDYYLVVLSFYHKNWNSYFLD